MSYYSYFTCPEIKTEDLIGQTFEEITGMENGSREINFKTADGRKLTMYHCQDCCESVELEDVAGDVKDLIGSPLTLAETVTSNERQEGVAIPEYHDESFTYTFYKFATVKGYVTLRWFGSSNGYYSESVDFIDVTKAGEDG